MTKTEMIKDIRELQARLVELEPRSVEFSEGLVALLGLYNSLASLVLKETETLC